MNGLQATATMCILNIMMWGKKYMANYIITVFDSDDVDCDAPVLNQVCRVAAEQ
jgi:hypothetical protein